MKDFSRPLVKERGISGCQLTVEKDAELVYELKPLKNVFSSLTLFRTPSVWCSFCLKPVIFLIPEHATLLMFCWNFLSSFSLYLSCFILSWLLISCIVLNNSSIPNNCSWWSRVYHWRSISLFWWGWCYLLRYLSCIVSHTFSHCSNVLFMCLTKCISLSSLKKPCRASSTSCDHLLTVLLNAGCLFPVVWLGPWKGLKLF